jgi:hypothetical protein
MHLQLQATIGTDILISDSFIIVLLIFQVNRFYDALKESGIAIITNPTS